MTSARTSRVAWLPGSDRLRGECSCGAATESGDPAGLWTWLLAHPDLPGPVPDPDAGGGTHAPPAHRVRHPSQAAGPRAAVR